MRVLTQVGAVERHAENVVLLFLGIGAVGWRGGARRIEENAPSVRRPVWMRVVESIRGQRMNLGPIRPHDVHIRFAASAVGEGNQLSGWRISRSITVVG